MKNDVDFIVKTIKEKGITAYKIAEETSLTEVGINKILNGKSKTPRKNTLQILHNYLFPYKENLQNNYLEESKEKYKSSDPTGYYYPNVSAAAGMDKEMQNDELKRLPINLPNWDKGIDFINVYGDSMYPKFCSGEIIGIKEVELQYMNFGYAYVVILKDEQVLLKYIKKGSNNEHIILESENDFYEPKEYHLEQIKKVFIIKGVITKTTM